MVDVRWLLVGVMVLLTVANVLLLSSVMSDREEPKERQGQFHEECAEEELRQRVTELDQAFADLAHGYAHLDADMKEAEEAKCIIRNGATGHFAVRSDDHSAEHHGDHEKPAFKRYQLFSIHSFDPLDLQAACTCLEQLAGVHIAYELHHVVEQLEATLVAVEHVGEYAVAKEVRNTLGDATLKAALVEVEKSGASGSIVGLASSRPLPLRPLLSSEMPVLVAEREVGEAIVRLLWQLVVTMAEDEARATALRLGWEVAAGVSRKRAMAVKMTPELLLAGEEDMPLACALVDAWHAFAASQQTYVDLYGPVNLLPLSKVTPGRALSPGFVALTQTRTSVETAATADMVFENAQRVFPNHGAPGWWRPFVTPVLEACLAAA